MFYDFGAFNVPCIFIVIHVGVFLQYLLIVASLFCFQVVQFSLQYLNIQELFRFLGGLVGLKFGIYSVYKVFRHLFSYPKHGSFGDCYCFPTKICYHDVRSVRMSDIVRTVL